VPNYSYNSSNQLTSNSNGSYTYDANGSTLADASGKSYTWDFDNRLTQVVNPGVGTTALRYDPFGRRIQKSGPLGTTNYLYDGKNLLEELDGAGSVLARYMQSSGIDKPLAELRSGTVSYYQQDALGSVTSLSNSAGALANTYSYDSFGKLTASTGTLTNPFQYAGREFDPETGIYENRFRYYNQSTGRFISEDPVGFLGGINKYAYVLNMPTNFSDPSGLDCPENPTDCVHSPDERAQMQRDHDATMQRILGPDVPDNGPNKPPSPPASNCKNHGKGDCASAYAETAIGGAWIVGWVAVDVYLLLPAIYEEGVAEGTMLAFGHGAATIPGVGGVLMYVDGIGNITANCPLLVDWFLGD
jgi:RHS repeat-associated protein